MTRISFYLDTRNIRSIDVHDVNLGNPGMGGTEYMFFLIAKYLARTHGTSRQLKTFVQDRACHDRRHAIDATKIREDLGWKPETSFAEGLRRTVEWILGRAPIENTSGK